MLSLQCQRHGQCAERDEWCGGGTVAGVPSSESGAGHRRVIQEASEESLLIRLDWRRSDLLDPSWSAHTLPRILLQLRQRPSIMVVLCRLVPGQRTARRGPLPGSEKG